MKFEPYAICDLLTNDGSTLSKIVDKVNAINECQALFDKILGVELTQQCRLGQFENGVMTLLTHSAAIATQLRFRVPELLSQLRQNPSFAGLCSIQIKIAQYMPSYKNEIAPDAPKAPRQSLPPDIAAQFRCIAEDLKGDDHATKALIASLLKISKNEQNP